MFSLGAGWSPSDAITVDVAYFYLHEDEAKVNVSRADRGSYTADYQNTAHAIGTSLTYRF